MTDHIPATREYDEGSVGRVGSLVLNVRELQEPVLYAAALSEKSIEKAGELVEQGQRMSLQALVEMRSRELQTKEKQKGGQKGCAMKGGDGQRIAEPEEQWVQMTTEARVEEQEEVEETEEGEMPLMRKKRRLLKASDARAAQAEGAARMGGQSREGAEQAGKNSREEREGEGQGSLPLVVVPFQAVPEEGSQPYVPEWPHVTKGSTLLSAEAKLEWLQNCLPPNVLDGYREIRASSVVGLGVQSALLGVIAATQAERVMAKQARYLRDYKRSYKTWEEAVESSKTRQQELTGEVASLTADLSKAREQLASQEVVVKEKGAELAGKEKELASWAAEARRMQEEIEKAQAEAAEAKKERSEAERVAAEIQTALELAERVREYLMKIGIREMVAKIFASDDYVSEVAVLVPILQATGRVTLL